MKTKKDANTVRRAGTLDDAFRISITSGTMVNRLSSQDLSHSARQLESSTYQHASELGGYTAAAPAHGRSAHQKEQRATPWIDHHLDSRSTSNLERRKGSSQNAYRQEKMNAFVPLPGLSGRIDFGADLFCCFRPSPIFAVSRNKEPGHE